MQRVIRLPNARRVTLATYVAAWRTLKATPAETRVAGFDHFPRPAGDVLAAIHAGLHDRINKRGGVAVRSSRVHPASYSQARTPRVILEPDRLRTFPPAARKALAHRAPDID